MTRRKKARPDVERGPYEVNPLIQRALGGGGIVLFIFCFALAYQQHEARAIALFVFLVIAMAYLVVSAGRFVLDDAGITHQAIFGVFCINGNDIKRIEVGRSDKIYVFHGNNKRFVLASPLTWSGPHKHTAHSFLQAKIRSLGLIPELTPFTSWKFNKNVRIAR